MAHTMPPSTRERQKEQRRSDIYRAAIALFRERGFEATTASEIAQVSGVSRGTFFNYYPYKEAVLLDYGSEVVARLEEQARAELAQGIAPLQVLNTLWRRLAEENARERDLFLPLAHEVLHPSPERAWAAYQALPLSRTIELILTPLHTAGQLRPDISLPRLSRMIADTYLLMALRWSAEPPAAQGQAESVLQGELGRSLDLLLRGALQHPAAP